jgi:hypothetical protein
MSTKTFADLMGEAKPAERSVPICMRGDLVAQLEQLEAAADEARRSTSKEGDGLGDLVEQIEALQAEMREATYAFRLRALPPRRYRALTAKYPPRRDDEGKVDQGDLQRGFSLEMIPELIRVSTFDPELSEDKWRELLGDTEAEAARREAAGEPVEDGKLTDAQCWQLGNAAHQLNEGEISVPFSPAVLLRSQRSGGESKPPSSSASPRPSSTAGKVAKPRPTSTTAAAG